MASDLRSTIDIVTTNGRYAALRQGDPIWSGFLPDAEILGNAREYIVSKEVSEAIDSQWDAYNRLLAFLGGIGYIEYKGKRDAYDVNASGIEFNSSTHRLSVLGRRHTVVKKYTRSELLRNPTHGGRIMKKMFRGVRMSGESSEWVAYGEGKSETHCKYALYIHNDESHERFTPSYVGITIYGKPDELVYYDEVDRIAYILNLPEGFEYWVPVRGVLLNSAVRPEVARRDRIAHTTRAGQIANLATPICIEAGDVQTSEFGVMRGQKYWRYLADRLQGLPRWLGDVSDFLAGVTHFASLVGCGNSPHSRLSDVEETMWGDVHCLRASSILESTTIEPSY